MKWSGPACTAQARAESSTVPRMRREEVEIGFPYLAAHIETQSGSLSFHTLPPDDNVPW